MMQNELILKRVWPPGDQDTAPFGTKCLVAESGHKIVTYIQKSEDENHPKWEIIECTE